MVSEARDIDGVDDLLDDRAVGYQGLADRVRLQREGRTLAAVAFAAERLMAASCWLEVADEVLARLGEAAEVSRVYVFENHDDGGELRTKQRSEWVAPGVAPGPVVDDPQGPTYAGGGFERWVDVLSAGSNIQASTSDLPRGEREALEAQGIQSILVVPIFVGQRWWGFAGFDRCEKGGDWSAAEADALKAAAGMLGTAIQRERSETARRESDERFRRLVELAPDGIVVHRRGEVASPIRPPLGWSDWRIQRPSSVGRSSNSSTRTPGRWSSLGSSGSGKGSPFRWRRRSSSESMERRCSWRWPLRRSSSRASPPCKW